MRLMNLILIKMIFNNMKCDDEYVLYVYFSLKFIE